MRMRHEHPSLLRECAASFHYFCAPASRPNRPVATCGGTQSPHSILKNQNLLHHGTTRSTNLVTKTNANSKMQVLRDATLSRILGAFAYFNYEDEGLYQLLISELLARTEKMGPMSCHHLIVGLQRQSAFIHDKEWLQKALRRVCARIAFSADQVQWTLAQSYGTLNALAKLGYREDHSVLSALVQRFVAMLPSAPASGAAQTRLQQLLEKDASSNANSAKNLVQERNQRTTADDLFQRFQPLAAWSGTTTAEKESPTTGAGSRGVEGSGSTAIVSTSTSCSTSTDGARKEKNEEDLGSSLAGLDLLERALQCRIDVRKTYLKWKDCDAAFCANVVHAIDALEAWNVDSVVLLLLLRHHLEPRLHELRCRELLNLGLAFRDFRSRSPGRSPGGSVGSGCDDAACRVDVSGLPGRELSTNKSSTTRACPESFATADVETLKTTPATSSWQHFYSAVLPKLLLPEDARGPQMDQDRPLGANQDRSAEEDKTCQVTTGSACSSDRKADGGRCTRSLERSTTASGDTPLLVASEVVDTACDWRFDFFHNVVEHLRRHEPYAQTQPDVLESVAEFRQVIIRELGEPAVDPRALEFLTRLADSKRAPAGAGADLSRETTDDTLPFVSGCVPEAAKEQGTADSAGSIPARSQGELPTELNCVGDRQKQKEQQRNAPTSDALM
ncbi:unnamed protein product [Amoebophrya sp. A120]|nr:unnamed protein product [Amoebophrya sp. A120]|eukprot:GSA120T00017385001.1